MKKQEIDKHKTKQNKQTQENSKTNKHKTMQTKLK